MSRDENEPPEAVDLRAVIDSTINLCRQQIARRAQLKVHMSEHAPRVLGSATRIGQVLLNLLVNAVQATPPGAPERHEISLGVRESPPHQIAISVSDMGSGIAPENVSRIFDPFFTTKAASGTGLGLAICHKHVSSMGGQILVDSVLGSGSVFTVVLPAAHDANRAVEPVATGEPEPANIAALVTKVLVVEDETPLWAALRRVLRGCDLTCVETAKDALNLILAGEAFDAILCDIVMPGESGLWLYQQVVSQRPAIAERFVFMTGSAKSPDAADFFAAISNPRIEKPFDNEQVRSLVESVTMRLSKRAVRTNN